MAEKHVAEVIEHCPTHVRGNRLFILHRLAVYANNLRLVWVGIETLMHETHASQSTVYEALGWLRDAGIVQEVDESTLPPWLAAYPSVVRRIAEPEHWTEGCPAPIYCFPDSGKELSFQNPESDIQDHLPKSGPYKESLPLEERETSSLYDSPSAHRPEPRKKSSWKKAAEEDEEIDQDKQLRMEEEAALAAERGVTETPSRKRRHHHIPEPPADSGLGLARYFVDKVTRVGVWRGIDTPNESKLASQLNRWLKGGVIPDQIRAMIDLYASTPSLRNKRKTSWTDFLAKRNLLADKVSHRFKKDPFEGIDWDDPEAFKPEAPVNDEPDEDGYVIDRSIWG